MNAAKKQFIEDLLDAMPPELLLGQTNLLTFGDYAVTGSRTNKDVNEKIARGEGGGFFNVGSLDVLRAIQEKVMTTSPVIDVKGKEVRIPAFFWGDYLNGYSTVFPPGIGMSATRDTALIEKVARAIAVEATANGVMGTYAPMADAANDPRWGRVVESPGEHVWWNGRAIAAWVKGFLGDAPKSVHRLQPTLKHFLAYGAVEAGREYNKVIVSPREILEKHLPPFIAGLKAGAKSVMMAFHTIDGIPCTVNETLYKILRKFDDVLIVSDYEASLESTKAGHGLGSLRTVARRALKAGLDMFMVDEGGVRELKDDVRRDRKMLEHARRAARNVLTMKMEMGLFDDPYRFFDNARAAQYLNDADHAALARQAATDAAVLLKNDNRHFPLPKGAKVALVGPLANDAKHFVGSVIGAQDRETRTILSCMRDIAGDPSLIRYAKGANFTDDPDLIAQLNLDTPSASEDEAAAMRAEAVAAANGSDYVVAVVGRARGEDGEGCSHTSLDLHECQKKLLRDLAATGKPIFIWAVSGTPMTLGEEEHLADALAWTTHAGTEAGPALAALTYGDANFSGRLPITFPRATGQCPIYLEQESTGRPAPFADPALQTGDPANWPRDRAYQKWKNSSLKPGSERPGDGDGRGESTPIFWANHGLSYSAFEYGAPQVSTINPSGDDVLKVTVQITNPFNSVAGRATTALYLTDPEAKISRPVLMLRGVHKTAELQPGQSETATFEIRPDDFAYIASAKTLTDFKRACESGEIIISTGPTPTELQSITVNWTKPKPG